MKKELLKIIADDWSEESDNHPDWIFYRTDEYIRKIIDNPYSIFHPTLANVIKDIFPDLHGKRVCVPSSGDNRAVFAFHLLGAKVTSSDISVRQLANAEATAKKYGWDIEFILDNTMTLEKIEEGAYDWVFTSNGVHVWIDDLMAMYKSIYKILNTTGVYTMCELHPIDRPIDDCFGELKIRKPYGEIGPYFDGVNYHWRTQDYVNAIAEAGLSITHMEEFFDSSENGCYWFSELKRTSMTKDEINRYYDWRINPQAALPQWLSICAMKQMTKV